MAVIEAAVRPLLEEVIAWYRLALGRNQGAWRWLAAHHLDDPALADQLEFGVSDRGLGAHLPHRGRPRAGDARERLTRVGLLRPTGREAFDGCLTIPVRGRDGALTQCFAVRTGAGIKPRVPRTHWLAVSRRALWNAAAAAERELVVAGSILDGIAILRAGVSSCVVPCTEEPGGAWWIRELSATGVRRVHLALRVSAHSEATARRWSGMLDAAGIRSRPVDLPHGMGALDLLMARGGDRRDLLARLREGWTPLVPSADVTGVHHRLAIAEGIDGHLAAMRASGAADSTVRGRRRHLGDFLRWSERQGVRWLDEVDRRRLEAYREHLVGSRETSGRAGPATVHRLRAVRLLLRWAHGVELVSKDASAGFALPRLPRRLPRAVLTLEEAERVLRTADGGTAEGLRDRALLELAFSTGLRRTELTVLDVEDVDLRRATVHVREGKGRKDRIVPVGARALGWVREYLERSRPALAGAASGMALFLSARGRRMRPTWLTGRLRRYIVAAGVNKPGSVHIWRHSMATLMHDAGADIRDLQEMLGHALLTTTQLYTHVSVARLQEVHRRTHPAEAEARGAP